MLYSTLDSLHKIMLKVTNKGSARNGQWLSNHQESQSLEISKSQLSKVLFKKVPGAGLEPART